MWFLPSRGRPHLIERVFSVSPPSGKGLLLLDDDDAPNYAGVKLPPRWGVHVVSGCNGVTQVINRAFSDFPNEEFYGVLNDDMVPETLGWDALMGEAAGSFDIVGAHQVHTGGRIGAIAFGGDLARLLGWVVCPAVRHFYGDDAFELMIGECGFTGMREDIRIPHLHFTAGLADYDATYARRGSSAKDCMAFAKWRDSEWPAIRDKINAHRRVRS